jgi:protein subunit release factor B
LSAVVQINGAGGTESCDWAEMLAHVHDEEIAKIKELNSRKEAAGIKP